jgi:hypothetical protein
MDEHDAATDHGVLYQSFRLMDSASYCLKKRVVEGESVTESAVDGQKKRGRGRMPRWISKEM